MRLIRNVAICLILALATGVVWGDVRLPELIGDHMVLQRNSPLTLWGEADPGERIRVVFHGQRRSTIAKRDGGWSMSLGPYPAGGPYELVLSGKNTVTLHDVLLGDVWLASGQSNMAYPVKSKKGYQVDNADAEVRDAHFPDIRIFSVDYALKPQARLSADAWRAVSPESVGEFSAVAYFFGEELHQRYGVPIGLIQSAVGGTPAEAWMSRAALDRLADFQEPQSSPPSRNTPSTLFNSMIDPLVRLKIKGVIWYQGESNALDNRSLQYRTLFPALIEDWRRHWGYDVPFLFVQLPGYVPDPGEPKPVGDTWSQLREAQAGALTLPNTGMVMTLDLGPVKALHPTNKRPVAHRLALAAEKIAYREHIIASGPPAKSVQREASSLRIRFCIMDAGLAVQDVYGYVRGFEIAAADGVYYPTQARRDGEDIVISNEAVPDAVSIRYDWGDAPDGNLFNREGLPAHPFRVDLPRGVNQLQIISACP